MFLKTNKVSEFWNFVVSSQEIEIYLKNWTISQKWNFGIWKNTNFQNRIVFCWKSKLSKNKSSKNEPLQNNCLRWKSHLHYHLRLRLVQNQTSIHKEHFSCGTFAYQHGFIKEEHVQRSPRAKKMRCSWYGNYLHTSMAIVR